MKNIILLITFLFFVSCAYFVDDDNLGWLMKIEDEKIKIDDFNSAYDSFIVMQSQSFQLSPEELKDFIKDPESAPDKSLQQVLHGLTKKSFVDNYKTFLLANLEAKDTGFLKRKDIKRRLKFINQFFIASLYLEEQVPDEDFEVTHQETMEAWEEIRKENPQYARVPLEQGLKLTKRSLVQQKKQQLISEQFKGLIQKYKIEDNLKVLNLILKEPVSQEQKKNKTDSK